MELCGAQDPQPVVVSFYTFPHKQLTANYDYDCRGNNNFPCDSEANRVSIPLRHLPDWFPGFQATERKEGVCMGVCV